MAFEIIKSIVEAETQAEGIITDAFNQAEKLKADALVKSDEIVAQTKADAKQNAVAMIERAVSDNQPKKAEIEKEAHDKCEQIKEAANKRMDEAVDAVVRKVVG